MILERVLNYSIVNFSMERNKLLLKKRKTNERKL